jgi:protein TonB
MFDSFQKSSSDPGTKRRFAFSTAAAMGAYVATALVVATFAERAVAIQEKVVDVTFEKTLPKKEPEPPPPPRPAPVAKRIERPKAPAPEAPPPPPPAPAPVTVAVPKAVPKERLAEAEPTADKPSFIPPAEGIGGVRGGVAGGVAGGVLGGTGSGDAVGTSRSAGNGPINLPEEATPPVESPDNRRPEYPEVARAAGREGKVILKVVITEGGRVGDIKVLKGDEPFVQAAVSVVKGWRYQPAMLAGHAISVFRIVQIPFRLSIGGG